MPTPRSSNYLFVYGSLRRDAAGRKHPFLKTARCLGPASLAGFLYDAGRYPGLIPARASQAPQAQGELYRLPAARERALLARLDHYEECTAHFPPPREFQRRWLPVNFRRQQVRAWVYVYNHPPQGLTRLQAAHYPRRAG